MGEQEGNVQTIYSICTKFQGEQLFVLDFRGTIVCTRFQEEQLFVLDFRGSICFLTYKTELQIVFVYVCMLPLAGQIELTVERLPKIQMLHRPQIASVEHKSENPKIKCRNHSLISSDALVPMVEEFLVLILLLFIH